MLAPLLFLLAAQGAVAPSLRVHPTPATVDVYYETDPGGLKLTARLENGSGPVFGLLATFESQGRSLASGLLVAAAPLDARGAGTLSVVFSESLLQALPEPLHLSGVYLEQGGVVLTPEADLVLGCRMACETLDFNHTLGDDSVMVAGKILASEWADMGMFVEARNARPAGPDLPILFDSGNPSGEDLDLMTPNPSAVGNDTPLGMLLIIAEDDVDVAPPDGLVDDPDDEQYGGSLFFDFESKAAICAVTLVDVDEVMGAELRFYRDGDLVVPDETIHVLSLGDGSVQRIEFYEPDVDRFEVFFYGSGGVGPIDLVPCPTIVNFDETSTGIPRDMRAGEWLTEQLAGMGLTIEAHNNTAGHPDKAILFDSENPTGEDFDLLTPNPDVPGNDTPLGLVLILAEDDVDVAPADGFVDDPDDEAGGGVISFLFMQDVTFLSARVLDVDGAEEDYWRFYDREGFEITSILIPDLPDGNVQTIEAFVPDVARADLELGGSGAVTRIRFCKDRKSVV